MGPGFGTGLALNAAGFSASFLFVTVVGTGSVGVAGLGCLVALALASAWALRGLAPFNFGRLGDGGDRTTGPGFCLCIGAAAATAVVAPTPAVVPPPAVVGVDGSPVVPSRIPVSRVESARTFAAKFASCGRVKVEFGIAVPRAPFHPSATYSFRSSDTDHCLGEVRDAASAAASISPVAGTTYRIARQAPSSAFCDFLWRPSLHQHPSQHGHSLAFVYVQSPNHREC